MRLETIMEWVKRCSSIGFLLSIGSWWLAFIYYAVTGQQMGTSAWWNSVWFNGACFLGAWFMFNILWLAMMFAVKWVSSGGRDLPLD